MALIAVRANTGPLAYMGHNSLAHAVSTTIKTTAVTTINLNSQQKDTNTNLSALNIVKNNLLIISFE